MVRPEKSTSSTRTTVLPSTPSGGTWVRCSARAGRSRRSSRCMVTSSEPTGAVVHVDAGGAAGRGGALELPDPRGQAAGKVDAAGGDAEQDDPLAAVRPFQ